MLRTIVTPINNSIILSIPNDYVGKPIEVTYLALEELQQKAEKKTMADFWGIISDDTANQLHAQVEQNRSQWDSSNI